MGFNLRCEEVSERLAGFGVDNENGRDFKVEECTWADGDVRITPLMCKALLKLPGRPETPC
jgi:hypothetical protein